MKHFISIAQTSEAQLRHVFDVAFALRRERAAGVRNQPILAGKTLAMIFEKPSLRTRVSFEVAIRQLGGDVVILASRDTPLGRGETIADTARVRRGQLSAL
jgi:ornithine carbamoyltransferase